MGLQEAEVGNSPETALGSPGPSPSWGGFHVRQQGSSSQGAACPSPWGVVCIFLGRGGPGWEPAWLPRSASPTAELCRSPRESFAHEKSQRSAHTQWRSNHLLKKGAATLHPGLRLPLLASASSHSHLGDSAGVDPVLVTLDMSSSPASLASPDCGHCTIMSDCKRRS